MTDTKHLYLIFKEGERYFTISDGLNYRGGQSVLTRALANTDYRFANTFLEYMGFTLKNILPLAFWE